VRTAGAESKTNLSNKRCRIRITTLDPRIVDKALRVELIGAIATQPVAISGPGFGGLAARFVVTEAAADRSLRSVDATVPSGLLARSNKKCTQRRRGLLDRPLFAEMAGGRGVR